nr:hypothetical protein [Anaerolineales bacterium]
MKRLTTLLVLTLVGTLLAACPAPTPQVIEKQVVVEKPVVETVIVEKEVIVEKVVSPPPAPLSAEELARAQTLNIAITRPYSDPTNLNVYAGADRSRSGIHQVVYEYFFY